jgi:hypothetical protein
MGLTLEAEQRLEKVGLVTLFEKDRPTWLGVSQKTYNFVKDGFPTGAMIRRDDVQKGLIPILEVHEQLREYLDTNKLRGKFWISFYADLIIDRTWDEVRRANNGNQ